MEKPLEPFDICAECHFPKAELRFREETVKRDGAVLHLERIPYYHCPRCGEETYDLDVEVFVERAIKEFKEGNVEGRGAIDVGAEFHISSELAVR
ncbi:MAG TPA: YgiT-type zinc finger protein [Desulfotomaculum sp.]|nr:YgiT-type zinc finger protein [Desulfotomaculum sp.]